MNALRSPLNQALAGAMLAGRVRVKLQLHMTRQVVLTMQFDDLATADKVHDLMLGELSLGNLVLEIRQPTP